MSAALQLIRTAQTPALDRPIRTLPVPWRDPHTVSPAELKEYIGFLEKACEEHPRSADLRTCLGMAYAMNYDVYKSMDALEAAVGLDETHFFAQMKYAELFYRLRALERAEEETVKAARTGGQRMGTVDGAESNCRKSGSGGAKELRSRPGISRSGRRRWRCWPSWRSCSRRW